MIDNKIEPKNILIYGAGAIGSLMDYLLSDAHSSDGDMVENVALLGRPGHMVYGQIRGAADRGSPGHEAGAFQALVHRT